MPLEDLERWLHARVDRQPIDTSLAMLDGYVAGPMSMSQARLDLSATRPSMPMLSTTATPRSPRQSRRRTSPQRHQQRPYDCARPVRADAPAQAQWRCRSATPVSGILRRDAAQAAGVGTAAGRRQCRSRPASARFAALSRRSGPSAARTATKGPETGDILPNAYAMFQRRSRPCANTGCRSATPAQLITANVGAHTGYDLGAVRTRALPADDGTYRIFGQKIFITYGDHGLTENIVHLVLARMPDAPPGVRGLSLLRVPKFISEGHERTRNHAFCKGPAFRFVSQVTLRIIAGGCPGRPRLRDAAVEVGATRSVQLAVVVFENVGVYWHSDGRIVELDRVVGVVVLRNPAPSGTISTPQTNMRGSGAFSLVEAGIAADEAAAWHRSRASS